MGHLLWTRTLHFHRVILLALNNPITGILLPASVPWRSHHQLPAPHIRYSSTLLPPSLPTRQPSTLDMAVPGPATTRARERSHSQQGLRGCREASEKGVLPHKYRGKETGENGALE